ncbi:hypothetical protein WKW79_07715 [Variovorax robiniae]|uniref:PsbP C-terminal domain-containing protein n=1 Tax=Variovorax robiniae TaxID=1836199 RepID=A0ABU8X5S3_9BURK
MRTKFCANAWQVALSCGLAAGALLACPLVRGAPPKSTAPSSAAAAAPEPPAGYTRFKADSYSLDHPTAWTYQKTEQGGRVNHMFQGEPDQNAMPYCMSSQQKPAPGAPGNKMSRKERIDYFMKNSDEDLLFRSLNTLASAQAFRLVHMQASTVGTEMPGFMADFFFRVPQGFVYRVRVHYTFWRSGVFLLWCAAAAKNERDADSGFLRNLAAFQTVATSVRIRE